MALINSVLSYETADRLGQNGMAGSGTASLSADNWQVEEKAGFKCPERLATQVECARESERASKINR